MIANVLKRLRPPPPPATATCPAREHVPSPAAPCPAPGVGPGCAAAASRRDGHLGQTELFIQFTSLKLPRTESSTEASPSCLRGCSRALCLGMLCTPSAPCHAVPGRAGSTAPWPRCQAGQSCQAGAQAGTCARSRASSVHGHMPAEVRGQGPEVVQGHSCAARGGVHAGTPRCAEMHACACVSMHVHACPCVCMRLQPCLAPPAMPRASWGWGGPCRTGQGGGLACGELHTQHHPPTCAQPCPCPLPPRTRGLCGPRCPGWGSPSRSDGGGPAWKAEGSSR